jgi:hypothetical protein
MEKEASKYILFLIQAVTFARFDVNQSLLPCMLWLTNLPVAIVTSASTDLGAQTCSTLLRHNALVLGIDEEPVMQKDHRLFSALNTHFQTLQMDLGDESAVQKMIDHVKDRFSKEAFDILITFGEGEESIKLRREIAELMSQRGGGGVILNVLDEGSVGQSQDIAELTKQSGKTGVRAGVVLIDGHASGSEGWTMLEAPEDSIDEVRDCVNRFRALTEEDTDTEKGNRGIADLLLYLVSELGSDIGGVVTADGGWRPLQ